MGLWCITTLSGHAGGGAHEGANEPVARNVLIATVRRFTYVVTYAHTPAAALRKILNHLMH